ncbi:MAG: hypothetical protein ABIS36_20455 [Chryseolinea sp.]
MEYFLELVKKHALLYSILVNGNFKQVDLQSKNVVQFSDKAIEINMMTLGDHKFESVTIVLYDSFISVDFKTLDSKFFTDSKTYFSKDALTRYKKPYVLGDDLIEETFKDLGMFPDFDGRTHIILRHSELFNYSVNLRLYGKDFKSKKVSNPNYYIEGIEVTQEALHLFKPNEIVLIPIFTPIDYEVKFEIMVKNPAHPVLKYFASKAELSYENRIYKHGHIPRIDPFSVCGLTYLEQSSDHSGGSTVSTLKVELCGNKNDIPPYYNGRISYEVSQAEIQYFKIDQTLISRTELILRRIDLERDYILERTIFGKAAADEFNNSDCAQGVSVYKTK